MRWVEFKALARSQETPHLSRQTTPTTLHHKKKSALSSVLIQAAIFATNEARIMGLVRHLFIFPASALCQLE